MVLATGDLSDQHKDVIRAAADVVGGDDIIAAARVTAESTLTHAPRLKKVTAPPPEKIEGVDPGVQSSTASAPATGWQSLPMDSGARFKAGGREFDGKAGDNRWIVMKTGRAWEECTQAGPSFDKLKSDLSVRQKIAEEHGARIELHTNGAVPPHVKEWLEQREIAVIESR